MSEINIQNHVNQSKTSRGAKFWSIDEEVGLLSDPAGTEKRLEPRLARLMSILLEQAERTVSRKELVQRMWPDTIVNDESLTRAIADLRKFLRENYLQPPVIETASKQGYRVVLPDFAVAQAGNQEWLPRMTRIVVYGLAGAAVFLIVVRALSY